MKDNLTIDLMIVFFTSIFSGIFIYHGCDIIKGIGVLIGITTIWYLIKSIKNFRDGK